ncbi:glycosyltransferase family 2 protein [Edwardsiella piscicida]|uniref:glycosyltransferase family 2 protein n=1 Tax=Edwardsiella piscicida TaxID=1263550 RepID=UPI0002C0E633|nr:glycosyltransferase [Edwardsiella piscicida]AGH73261.1 family 2 glycosyl transferase [Edwardsiella piscicida C07-087]EKS7778947.1 glycosyltransferase [Edwardsiella piscicida]EKS7782367.1 glycosyltransferase [Edwardsiella piscicida]EKS7791934.1 glycosyltransferase [Edwardsiella piscicida]EKS7812048.1 glycosyltransferase [Edwardsiella piscicida]
MKLLSLIIPVYNTEMYLSACLESVFCQCDEDIEIIIVNDGSTDNSLDIIMKYKQNNEFVFIDKSNGGLSSARNSGLSVATGQYIAFLDSDDLWVDSCYMIIKESLQAYNPECLSFSYIPIDTKGNILLQEKSLKSSHKVIKCNPSVMFKKGDWFAWRFVYKSIFFSKIRFDEGRRFEDQLIIPILISQAKQIINHDSPIVKYRKHNASITSNLKLSDLKDSEFGIVRYIGLYNCSDNKEVWLILLADLYVSHISKCARLYHYNKKIANESYLYINRIIPWKVIFSCNSKALYYLFLRKVAFSRLIKKVKDEVIEHCN